jgi:predicted lipid-binding transport protein (Tim44 family)
MGEGFYYVDIIVFALIAGFLVYRLRSVLGQRSGEERQRPNPFATDANNQAPRDNVIPMPDRSRVVTPAVPVDEPFSLSAGIVQIQTADPSFEEKRFIQGAGAAFEIIVNAYATGDTATLRPLVSDDVYDSFSGEIRRRVAAGDSHETHIERIRTVELLEARLDGRNAVVTVKIVSDQMNVTRNAAGVILDGDPNRLLEVTDIWTFARNTRLKDPNWLLVETRTSN